MRNGVQIRSIGCLWIGGLLAGCMAVPTGTEPEQRVAPGFVSSAERVPTDVRRTTLIVRDIDQSLKLYRDVLGLTVNYDVANIMSGEGVPADVKDATGRFVLLSANDSYVGMIGLLQWVDPALPDPGPYPTTVRPGSVVIVLNSKDVDTGCTAAMALEGVTQTQEIRTETFEGRNGGPDIHVRGCKFFDPDGILIELNEVLR